MNQYSNDHFGMLPKDHGNGPEWMKREKVYEERMTHDKSQRQERPVLKETGLRGSNEDSIRETGMRRRVKWL